jgi:hypothetical protein
MMLVLCWRRVVRRRRLGWSLMMLRIGLVIVVVCRLGSGMIIAPAMGVVATATASAVGSRASPVTLALTMVRGR